jgi:hypothetical protein
MRIPRLRTVAIVLTAGIGLGGCATYSPYGYGSGFSVSLGDRYYDPYYDRYSPYGSRYGYGYAPYWGWNDGFYYPGSGYYVYDRYRNPYYWNDLQRRYWTARVKDPSAKAVWIDFARQHAARHGSGTTTTATTSSIERAPATTERVRTRRVERSRPMVERRETRVERREIRSADEDTVRSRRVARQRRTQTP